MVTMVMAQIINGPSHVFAGCCIYEKPHVFGESSSETDDECDHCRGHKEKKKTVPDPGSQQPTPAAVS